MMPVTGHQANRPFANCCHPLCFQQSIDSRAQMTLSGSNCLLPCQSALAFGPFPCSHPRQEARDRVCAHRRPPSRVRRVYKCVRALEFEDLPDYGGLRALFRGLAERSNIVYDGVFDWCVPRPGESRRSSEDGPAPKRKRVCRSCSACQAAAERAAAVSATKAAAASRRGRA